VVASHSRISAASVAEVEGRTKPAFSSATCRSGSPSETAPNASTMRKKPEPRQRGRHGQRDDLKSMRLRHRPTRPLVGMRRVDEHEAGRLVRVELGE
jgi:hypothetical protein